MKYKEYGRGMKYKLVTDGDLWAIKRRTLFVVRFYDFKDRYWWGRGSRFFRDCWTDKETAETTFKRFQA